MAKKKGSPPSKRDGEGACGAFYYGLSILTNVNHYRELTDDDTIPLDRIPIKIRIHAIGKDGIVKCIKTAPILYCNIVNGAICLGTYKHLLEKEKS